MVKEVHIWQMPAYGDMEFIHVAYLPAPIAQQVSMTCKLVYFEQGHKRFRYRQNRYGAVAGDLLIIPAGETHGADAPDDGSAELRILHLPNNAFETLLPGIHLRSKWTRGLSPPFVSNPALVQYFRQLHRRPDDFATPLEQQASLLHMLEEFTKPDVVPLHAPDPPAQENRVVRLLKEYIDAHYAGEITLTHLAEISRLHPAYLCRVFTQSVGMPSHAYQVALRIDRARSLLRKRLPVGQVALETGFYDQSHFNRHFRRLVQMPPAEYARRVKNVQDITAW